MMIEPVRTRNQWSPAVCDTYRQMRDLFVNKLRVEFDVPKATYFLFFSVEPYLHGRDYWDVVYALFDNGVSVAPGGDFGRGFENYIRLCFTGETEERLEQGIDRLNRVLVG